MVGILLREVEGHSEATLLLILLLLLNEGVDLGLEVLDGRGRATESDNGADRRDTDGDLVIGTVGLLLLDETAEALVELLGNIDRGRSNLLLLVDDVENLLASILQTLLESTDFVLRRAAGLDLGLGLRSRGSLKDKEDRGVDLSGLRKDNVDTVVVSHAGADILVQVLVVEGVDGDGDDSGRRDGVNKLLDGRLSLENVLAITRVQLVRGSAVGTEGGVDVSAVSPLDVVKHVTMSQEAGDVASVARNTTRGTLVETANVERRELHVHGSVHGSLNTLADLGSRANDGDGVIILISGQQDGATRLVEELIESLATAASNELVAALLKTELVDSKLLLQLLDATFDLSTGSLHSSAVTGQLDVVVAGRDEDGALALVHGHVTAARSPNLVRRNTHLNTVGLVTVDMAVAGARNEGVELSRNTTKLGVDVGSALAGNLHNLVAGRSSRQGVALNEDIDGGVVILVKSSTVLNLGKLDTGTRLLLDGLDGGTSLADDVGASRLGNRDLDGGLFRKKKVSLSFVGKRSGVCRPWFRSAGQDP